MPLAEEIVQVDFHMTTQVLTNYKILIKAILRLNNPGSWPNSEVVLGIFVEELLIKIIW